MEVYGLLASGGIYDWPVHKADLMDLGPGHEWNLQRDERGRDREYRCQHHYIYDHNLYDPAPAYDQTAEIL